MKVASAGSDEGALRSRVEQDPSDPVFAELAHLLRQGRRFEEARLVCYRGLTANPSAHRGRLALAWVYYDEGYHPFAQREVEFLAGVLSDNEYVSKLRDLLGVRGQPAVENASTEPVSAVSTLAVPAVTPPTQSVGETVHEAEIDLDDLG